MPWRSIATTQNKSQNMTERIVLSLINYYYPLLLFILVSILVALILNAKNIACLLMHFKNPVFQKIKHPLYRYPPYYAINNSTKKTLNRKRGYFYARFIFRPSFLLAHTKKYCGFYLKNLVILKYLVKNTLGVMASPKKT